MNADDIFEVFFGANNGQPLFNAEDNVFARFMYNAVREEFQADDESDDSDNESDDSDDESDDENNDDVTGFEEKIAATKENFKQIVELFKKTGKGRSGFLKNFEKWAPQCIDYIKTLLETAEEIHSDKFNCDIAKLVGVVVAAVGGIALALTYVTPLAPVTVPLTIGGAVGCGLGAGVSLGTSCTQMGLLKKSLDEARRVVKQHEDSFSLMAHWFTMPDQLKRKLDTLVSYDVLTAVREDFSKFFADVQRQTNMTIGDFKIRFKEVVRLCTRKMNKSGKLTTEFGDVLAPIVVVFVFLVCVVKGRNRIILDCVMINANLALSLLSILNLTLPASQIAKAVGKGAAEVADDIFKVAIPKILIGLNIVIDVLSIVVISIEVHKRPEPEQTKKLKEVAKQLTDMFLAIENVYNAVKKYEGEAPKEWVTIIVNSVPDGAEEEDIKGGVKSHLPYAAWDYIKLKKLSTRGNNWQVKVSERHSEQLMLQSHLIIKEQLCALIK